MAPPAGTFRLLGDEGRLRLVLLLAAEGPRGASALAAALGRSVPGVSRHLKLLRLAGLIGCLRRGKQVVYSLADGRVRDLLRGLTPAEPGRDAACP
jgi:ArsR family transcriptional regulator